MCLWKQRSLSKIMEILLTLSGWEVSLPNNLNGKSFASFFYCCFVPITIIHVLYAFSIPLLHFFHNEHLVEIDIYVYLSLIMIHCCWEMEKYGEG